jgi:hypothetical protein
LAKKNEEHEYDAQQSPAEAAAASSDSTPAAKPAKKYNFNNLNTLSVVSIATALTGFGAVAGVITGHIALAQLKSDGKQGRGLAIAGMVVGYAGIGVAVVSGIARAALGVWGARYGFEFGGAHMDDFGPQGMQQWGTTDQGGAFGQGGINQGDMGGMHHGQMDGFGGPMMGDQGGQGQITVPGTDPTAVPETQTN